MHFFYMYFLLFLRSILFHVVYSHVYTIYHVNKFITPSQSLASHMKYKLSFQGLLIYYSWYYNEITTNIFHSILEISISNKGYSSMVFSPCQVVSIARIHLTWLQVKSTNTKHILTILSKSKHIIDVYQHKKI